MINVIIRCLIFTSISHLPQPGVQVDFLSLKTNPQNSGPIYTDRDKIQAFIVEETTSKRLLLRIDIQHLL